MKSRINNKENEVPSEMATQTPVVDYRLVNVHSWTNDNGKVEEQYQYEVLGQVLTTNKELSEYELQNILRTLREVV